MSNDLFSLVVETKDIKYFKLSVTPSIIIRF